MPSFIQTIRNRLLARRIRRRAELGRFMKRQTVVIGRLRQLGVQIGADCTILTKEAPGEPYLVRIGDRVNVAGAVKFLTHDGAIHKIADRRPGAGFFGPIVIGDDCFIGENAILLPNTRIGAGSVVAAGSVLRGTFPVNCVIAGNPARVVGRATLLYAMFETSRNTIDLGGLSDAAKRTVLLERFHGELFENLDGESRDA